MAKAPTTTSGGSERAGAPLVGRSKTVRIEVKPVGGKVTRKSGDGAEALLADQEEADRTRGMTRTDRAIAGMKSKEAALSALESRPPSEVLAGIRQEVAPLLDAYFLVEKTPEQLHLHDKQLEAHLAFSRGFTETTPADIFAELAKHIAELRSSGRIDQRAANRFTRLVDLLARNLLDPRAPPSQINLWPPKFDDRQVNRDTGRRPTSIEWFDTHWRPLVLEGKATGDDIRREDARFYATWAATLSRRGEKVSDFLPPSPSRGKIQETEQERAERMRAGSRERMRRHRERQASPK